MTMALPGFPKQNRNFLFLDIDGVLNSETWAMGHGFGEPFTHKHVKHKTPSQIRSYSVKRARLNPASVYVLDKLCKELHCRVVMTTTWRLYGVGDSEIYWNDLFQTIMNESFNSKCHINVIGCTPDLTDEKASRGQEIQRWVEKNSRFNIENMIILDDIDDGISELYDKHFFKTDDTHGLSLFEYNVIHNCHRNGELSFSTNNEVCDGK